jgi:hypothetical protein
VDQERQQILSLPVLFFDEVEKNYWTWLAINEAPTASSRLKLAFIDWQERVCDKRLKRGGGCVLL